MRRATTARTTHLPEQKKDHPHVFHLVEKACSEKIHDLAHIPTQNCLADCLTEVSAKADYLITAVKTGKLFHVDTLPH